MIIDFCKLVFINLFVMKVIFKYKIANYNNNKRYVSLGNGQNKKSCEKMFK